MFFIFFKAYMLAKLFLFQARSILINNQWRKFVSWSKIPKNIDLNIKALIFYDNLKNLIY